MKNTKIIVPLIILILMLVVTSFKLLYKPISAPNNDSILSSFAEGTVVDLYSKDILKEANITCTSIKTGKVYKIELDETGKFRIQNLEIGDYTWTVDALGYRIAVYADYPIVTGGVEFTFEVTKDKKLYKSYKTDETKLTD